MTGVQTCALPIYPLQNHATEQRLHPARIDVANVPGMGTVTVRWIARGAGPFTVSVDSEKGGSHRRTSR